VLLVLKDRQDRKETKVSREHKVRQEQQVQRVILVLLEILVLLAPLVILVLLVLLEPLERWVTRDLQVHKDHKVTLDQLVQQERLVILDHKGLKGFRATLAQREAQDQLDHKVQREM
jgi:hypothetical protein